MFLLFINCVLHIIYIQIKFENVIIFIHKVTNKNYQVIGNKKKTLPFLKKGLYTIGMLLNEHSL